MHDDLDRVPGIGAPHHAGRCGVDASLDPREVVAPADHLGLVRAPVGAAAREEDQGLDEVRLAGRVRPDDDVRAGVDRELERVVAPEAREGQGPDGHRRCRPVRRAARCSTGAPAVRDRRAADAPAQDGVRTGMITWTYEGSSTGLSTPGASGPAISIASWASSMFWSASSR